MAMSVMQLLCCSLRQFSTKVGFKTVEKCTVKVVYFAGWLCLGKGEGEEETVALSIQCCLAASAARNSNGSRST